MPTNNDVEVRKDDIVLQSQGRQTPLQTPLPDDDTQVIQESSTDDDDVVSLNDDNNGTRSTTLSSSSSSQLSSPPHHQAMTTTTPQQQQQQQTKPSRRRRRPFVRLPILHYHNHWVCINKPAGMTVHRKRKRNRRNNINHNNNHHNSHIPSSQPQDPVVTTTLKRQLSRKVFPVHRLDHRTSGALLLAFDSLTAAALHGELQRAQKTYVALLRGHWDGVVPQRQRLVHVTSSSCHSIDNEKDLLTIAGHFPPDDDNEEFSSLAKVVPERIVVDKPLNVDGTTKQARTVFRKLAQGTLISSSSSSTSSPSVSAAAGVNLAGKDDEHDNTTATATTTTTNSSMLDCTLVLVEPQTGRTHQIRRHAYHLGMPILGDSQHGDSRVNRWCRTHAKLNRLALHCLAITSKNDNDNKDDDDDDNADEGSDNDDDDEEQDEDADGSVESNQHQDPPPTTTSSSKEAKNENNNNPARISSSLLRLDVVAPLPPELRQVLQQQEGMQDVWKQAVQIEPRLQTAFYDVRGGTLGISKKWQQRNKREQQQQEEEGVKG